MFYDLQVKQNFSAKDIPDIRCANSGMTKLAKASSRA